MAKQEPSSDTDGASTPGEQPEAKKPEAKKPEKVLPPSAKKKKKKVDTPSGDAKGRYTAPVPASKKGPSPRWVPVLMFAFWGIGLLMIILNYMGVLPGSTDGNGWYLVAGLGLILAGIVTATQYR